MFYPELLRACSASLNVIQRKLSYINVFGSSFNPKLQESRKELAADIETLKKKIAGTE